MRSDQMLTGAAGAGLAGLGLMVFEAFRVLTDAELHLLGTIVLFVGLALVLAAGGLVLSALPAAADPPAPDLLSDG